MKVNGANSWATQLLSREKKLWNFYVPEDAEDHNSCGKRYEGHTVANGVANLHLPEKLSLKKNNSINRGHSEGNWQKNVRDFTHLNLYSLYDIYTMLSFHLFQGVWRNAHIWPEVTQTTITNVVTTARSTNELSCIYNLDNDPKEVK